MKNIICCGHFLADEKMKKRKKKKEESVVATVENVDGEKRT